MDPRCGLQQQNHVPHAAAFPLDETFRLQAVQRATDSRLREVSLLDDLALCQYAVRVWNGLVDLALVVRETVSCLLPLSEVVVLVGA